MTKFTQLNCLTARKGAYFSHLFICQKLTDFVQYVTYWECVVLGRCRRRSRAVRQRMESPPPVPLLMLYKERAFDSSQLHYAIHYTTGHFRTKSR